MSSTVEELYCRGCGAPVSVEMTECPYGHPLNITTFNSVASLELPIVKNYADSYKKNLKTEPGNIGFNSSMGICYLKLGLRDEALAAFKRAIEDDFDDSEVYFCAAICLLKGKKAFVAQRADIDKMIQYLKAAIMIEPKGIYYYFLAYIKYDYFKRKFLNVSPTYQEELSKAKSIGFSAYDVHHLFSVLGVENPLN